MSFIQIHGFTFTNRWLVHLHEHFTCVAHKCDHPTRTLDVFPTMVSYVRSQSGNSHRFLPITRNVREEDVVDKKWFCGSAVETCAHPRASHHKTFSGTVYGYASSEQLRHFKRAFSGAQGPILLNLRFSGSRCQKIFFYVKFVFHNLNSNESVKNGSRVQELLVNVPA